MAPKERPKQQFDLIVLGLGAMGSAALLAAAKTGASVLGIEQFELAHSRGSSHGQTRLIRKAYFEHSDYVPLLSRAYELWHELNQKTGRRLYHETGLLYFCQKGGELEAGILGSAKSHGIRLEERSGDSRFKPPPDTSCLFEPEAGYLEVENCVRAHLDEAEKIGATILANEAVHDWTAREGGVTVTTASGTYSARKLVIAAGAWSGGILSELKLPFQLLRKTLYWLPANETYLEAQGAPCFFYELPDRVIYGFPRLTAGDGLKVAEHSGGKRIADPAELSAPADERDDSPTHVTEFARAYLSGVSPEVLRSQACMYTMTPDLHFIIDLHPRHPNVAFAAGFSGHGFKFSSAVGEILSELALTGNTRHPIDFLRLRNFSS